MTGKPIEAFGRDASRLDGEATKAAVCEADAPTTYPMDKTVEVSQAARDAAANDQHLVVLLRREGRQSGVWFGKHLLRAADLIEASMAEATTRATQPEAAMQDLLAAIDAWAVDPSADAEQRILDARAALKDRRHG